MRGITCNQENLIQELSDGEWLEFRFIINPLDMLGLFYDQIMGFAFERVLLRYRNPDSENEQPLHRILFGMKQELVKEPIFAAHPLIEGAL
jgi:hypothetical protein